MAVAITIGIMVIRAPIINSSMPYVWNTLMMLLPARKPTGVRNISSPNCLNNEFDKDGMAHMIGPVLPL